MLSPPSDELKAQPLPTKLIRVGELYRISRHCGGEPYFGTAASNRFDDDNPRKSRRFGTCYFGFDLETAIAETILHDALPTFGAFQVASADVVSRFLVRFTGANSDLSVADLTGLSLKRLGGTGALSTIIPYDLPRQWAKTSIATLRRSTVSCTSPGT